MRTNKDKKLITCMHLKNKLFKTKRSLIFYVLFVSVLVNSTLHLLLPKTVNAVGTVNTVPTFHSMSVEWDPPSASASNQANVQFRRSGEQNWHQGLPLWYSETDGLYRGSLVHLQPDTTYEIELSLSGTTETTSTTAKTWSENFPVAQTIELPENSTQTYTITQSGTPTGYILYTHAPGKTATIDSQRARDFNMEVRASYVIIRGLTLKNPAANNIKLRSEAHHVVIENNDFSGWGIEDEVDIFGTTSGAIDSNTNSTITNIIIQRNKFHDPGVDTNSWGETDTGTKDTSSSGNHPGGPQAIYMYNAGGSLVIRYNDIYSDNGNRYNDCIGGGANFSEQGFPPKNSDIYGNFMEKCWDNAIESEGGNENIRIWGNYMNLIYKFISTRDTNRGPLYMWRNVANISEKYPKELWTWDEDKGGSFHKAGGESGNDFGVYVFHNTALQPTTSGVNHTIGAREGSQGPMDFTTTRNNIFQVNCPTTCYSIQRTGSSTTNSFDYDLYNGILSPSGIEPNGIKGTPTYASNFGFNTTTKIGNFSLATTSLGYDRGQVIPNFNSEYFTGSGPDVGAHEAGKPAMEFGINAYLSGEPYTIGSNGIPPTPFPTPTLSPSTGLQISPTPVASATVTRYFIQAEDFTVTSSFVKQLDTSALNGSYLTTITGTNNSTGVSEATYNITIPTTEQYAVWARLQGETATSDASYVGVDGTLNRIYPSVLSQYQWVQVLTNTTLTNGQHTINLGHGEIGGRIDAILVTNNLSDVPDSLPWPSPSDMNCSIADINQDSQITLADFSFVLADFLNGTLLNPRSDIQTDMRVNALDFATVLRCQTQ